MEKPSLDKSIVKLASAGEQAGLSIQEMIDLLQKGTTVEGLLRFIEWRLTLRTGPSLVIALGHVEFDLS